MKHVKTDKFNNLPIIGTDIMRKKMGELLDAVHFRGDEYIIERKDKKLAALIPIDKYNALTKLARQLLLARLSIKNDNSISDQDVINLTNEVKHLVRNYK